jgi:hypothetical protein
MNKAKKLLKSESVDDILFIGEVGLSWRILKGARLLENRPPCARGGFLTQPDGFFCIHICWLLSGHNHH